jgi:hypothetical protein
MDGPARNRGGILGGPTDCLVCLLLPQYSCIPLTVRGGGGVRRPICIIFPSPECSVCYNSDSLHSVLSTVISEIPVLVRIPTCVCLIEPCVQPSRSFVYIYKWLWFNNKPAKYVRTHLRTNALLCVMRAWLPRLLSVYKDPMSNAHTVRKGSRINYPG